MDWDIANAITHFASLIDWNPSIINKINFIAEWISFIQLHFARGVELFEEIHEAIKKIKDT